MPQAGYFVFPFSPFYCLSLAYEGYHGQGSAEHVSSFYCIVSSYFHFDSMIRMFPSTSSEGVKISGRENTAIPPQNNFEIWNPNNMPRKHIKKYVKVFSILKKLCTFNMK